MNAACWETNDEIKKWKAQYESSGNVVFLAREIARRFH